MCLLHIVCCFVIPRNKNSLHHWAICGSWCSQVKHATQRHFWRPYVLRRGNENDIGSSLRIQTISRGQSLFSSDASADDSTCKRQALTSFSDCGIRGIDTPLCTDATVLARACRMHPEHFQNHVKRNVGIYSAVICRLKWKLYFDSTIFCCFTTTSVVSRRAYIQCEANWSFGALRHSFV